MTFTIEFGFWMVPTTLTAFGLLHVLLIPQKDQLDVGGAIVGFGWVCVVATAWIMWGLSWLI